MNKNGYPPTIREISDHFGFSSPSGALAHVEAIEKKGYIKRDKASRGIKVLSQSPFDITLAELIGWVGKSGKIIKSNKKIHLAIPSNEKSLLAVKSAMEIAKYKIINGDYIIFNDEIQNGLVLLKKDEDYFIGIHESGEVKDLSGNKIDGEIKGSFYGILRIPERRDFNERDESG
ncbi:SOS-response repressor and protease LexA [Athalassotoga saccharophila]|nr:SOS-response repressor and protease LexA [Athalassotoga saccharophila]